MTQVKPISETKVVVGLSGGVDSSVAAYLLKKQGYQVIGLFMKNWHDDSVTISDECPWLEDSNDALIVADRLQIPFQTIDLSEEYKKRIVDYMFAEYQSGRTPNPDVLCNREIKFDVFMKQALALGADYVATGHYCRREELASEGKSIYRLLSGLDRAKDQSYFLCQLSQQQLAKSLFPIGHLQKAEVRSIAREANLITAEKRDSQGLCFIGKVRLPDFLQQRLASKKGRIIEIPNIPYDHSNAESLQVRSMSYAFNPDMGIDKGFHQGAHFFTIGQRKGLAVGGTKDPLFIIGIDTIKNLVYVGQGSDHWALWRDTLYIEPSDLHYVREDLKHLTEVKARIRYRQPLESATLITDSERGGVYLRFERKQSAITPGQFAAWYHEDELIGSGVIS
ncbi:MAG: tRNA 2-thiouridine(34) synthase MnmA [Bacteroidetes bacterium]|nr:tRNA 2-thiouridine(34) synthase MnmA [Bacteroidota bacterium]MDA0950829.1 tRNA 2-thiouridine(34) synthase MnmA [Bacteroidota bacterium]